MKRFKKGAQKRRAQANGGMMYSLEELRELQRMLDEQFQGLRDQLNHIHGRKTQIEELIAQCEQPDEPVTPPPAHTTDA